MESLEQQIEELIKAAHYWKNKDPKKYRAMLNKLKNERKKPGSKERGYQQVLQAKRREKGGSGTTSGQNGKSGHSSGRMKSDTATAAKRYAAAEKKHGKKMSIDRKNNNKGYGEGNTRLISQKYNKGDEKYSKKAPEVKKSLKDILTDLLEKVNKPHIIQEKADGEKTKSGTKSIDAMGGMRSRKFKSGETQHVKFDKETPKQQVKRVEESSNSSLGSSARYSKNNGPNQSYIDKKKEVKDRVKDSKSKRMKPKKVIDGGSKGDGKKKGKLKLVKSLIEDAQNISDKLFKNSELDVLSLIKARLIESGREDMLDYVDELFS